MNKKNEETINEVDNNIIPEDPYARFEALKASEQAADAPEEESTHNPEEAISEQ